MQNYFRILIICGEECKDLTDISLEYILQTLDHDFNYSINGIL